MKIKLSYQISNIFYYEAECLNEQERKEAVKGLIYATKDLEEAKLLEHIETSRAFTVCEQNEEVLNDQMPIEYATEGQKKYMAKLNIPFTEETTKIEAIDLINAWKLEHGVPLTKK